MQIAKARKSHVQLVLGEMLTLLAREDAQVRLRSGEVRVFTSNAVRPVVDVGNEEHRRSIGKAGVKRWLGVRPTVRGVVMNPVDHLRMVVAKVKTGAGRSSSVWGNHTKGNRTRRNKRTRL